MTQWVENVILGVSSDVRFTFNSDQIAALRRPTVGPDLPIAAW
jgi:hypothetical protein